MLKNIEKGYDPSKTDAEYWDSNPSDVEEICHSFLITTFCYIVLRVFSSLDFSLMRSRGKHKQ